MEIKDTYTREEVIEMLREIQKETCECVGFIVGTVSQLWVVDDLLGKRISDIGGESIDYKVV